MMLMLSLMDNLIIDYMIYVCGLEIKEYSLIGIKDFEILSESI